MLIGIDNISPGTSTSASRTLGGMRPYLADLLDGLPALFPDWHFKLFTPEWSESFEARHPNLETVRLPAPQRRVPRVLFEQFLLPGQVAAHKIDLWLGTCNVLPLALGIPSVLLIQSHQFYTHPETFTRLRGAWLRWAVYMSAKRATRIGVQCEAAGQTLREYLDIEPARLRVIPNRTPTLQDPARFDVHSLLGARRPYLVYVSGFYPFKNHQRLVDAFLSSKALLHQHIPGLALVLTGGGSGAEQYRDLDPDILVTGRVPDAAIPALYRNAVASVFPSLEETFGLPVLEAMSLGCPVITSNRGAMAELAANAAALIDPEDTESISDGMVLLAANPGLRDELSRRGRQRAAAFTKERTVAALAGTMREVASLAYNTVGGSPQSYGSPGYTGTHLHLRPGASSVRPEKTA